MITLRFTRTKWIQLRRGYAAWMFDHGGTYEFVNFDQGLENQFIDFTFKNHQDAVLFKLTFL